jgi:ligand-binding sensor domain-containing protein
MYVRFRYYLQGKVQRLALLSVVFLTLSYSNECKAQSIWQQTSGPCAGNVKALAVAPNGHIFVGVDGGLLKSTDEGISWVKKKLRYFYASVNAVAVDSSGNLLVGTQGDGLFRSTDDGESWVHVDSAPLIKYAVSVAFDNVGNGYVGTYKGLFLSTDHGISWERIDTSRENPAFYCIVCGPSNEIYTYSEGWLWCSFDRGSNWRKNRTPDYPHAIIVNSQRTIYFAAERGLFRSIDTGRTWLRVSGIKDTAVTALYSSSSEEIFVGTYPSGGFRSLDSGYSWTDIGAGIRNFGVTAIVISRSGKILIGTSTFGVYASTDHGISWELSNTGIINSDVRALTANRRAVFAGTSETGIFRSSDHGENWVHLNSETLPISISDLATNRNGDLFAATYYGLYISTDDGNTWSITTDSVGINTVYIDPLERVFSSVGISIDNGKSWFNDSLWRYASNISAFCVDSDATIFAASWGSGVFRSSSTIVPGSWKRMNVGLTDTSVLSILFSKNGWLFAGTLNKGIFRSKDKGLHWEYLHIDSLRGYVFALLTTSEGMLLATGDIPGILYSSDTGNTWKMATEGLEDHLYSCLCIDSNGFMYAGSTCCGVYRSSQPVLKVQSIPRPSIISTTLSPNPVTTSTTIHFTIPEPEFVSLKVFDVSGREVSTIADRMYDPGEHEVTFDARELPNGVYFYRMMAGGHSETKSFLLTR